jgi:dTDP-4-amino-4,6-dideoxygalactose transaminase
MHGIGMFDKILKFEQELAEFTGAPYAVMTDCCTHAIEMCLRYDRIKECSFTPYTYLSIAMTMHKLGIKYDYFPDSLPHRQQWVGEYKFEGTRIWDSARRLEKGMYRSGQMQCLSFGHDKPLHIGRGGAILLDDETAYRRLIRMRYDGRDLSISPWAKQHEFEVGYHYKPTPEEAVQGIALLEGLKEYCPPPRQVVYPDLRTITIKD